MTPEQGANNHLHTMMEINAEALNLVVNDFAAGAHSTKPHTRRVAEQRLAVKKNQDYLTTLKQRVSQMTDVAAPASQPTMPAKENNTWTPAKGKDARNAKVRHFGYRQL